jgi:phosphatidylglycerol lysyltransferase
VTSEHARDVVLRYGWNSTAYQLLNAGFRHWYPAEGDGLVGFVAAGSTRVAGGAPVCAPERLGAVAREFERDAAAAGERVCWLGAGERLATELSGPGHAHSRIGAQPWWRPAAWEGVLAERATLRAQLNRARNKGVEVGEWDGGRASASPALASCLEAWLGRQHLPPLHFLVEPELLGDLVDRRVFVAERQGAIAGYLLLSPIPARNGWLVEQIVRAPDAPNGTTELLVDAAMRGAAAERAAYLTLGVAPLSSRAGPPGGTLWLRLALGWARAHGRRFYNFGGLEAFKAKFRPNGWEAAWLVTNDERVRARHLWAIAAAYTGDSPLRTLARALGRAVRDEHRRAWAGIMASRA